MPGLLQHRTNHERETLPTTEQTPSRSHAEDIELWLPSAVSDSIIRKSICVPGLPDIEDRLRIAQCHGALESMRRALRLKTHMCDFRNRNSRGQREGLRSRVQIDRIARQANFAAHKYRAARAAKLKLTGPGLWEEELQVLLDTDIRSYVDPDKEANRKRNQGVKKRRRGGDEVAAETGAEGEVDFDAEVVDTTRRPGGESSRIISWIWRMKNLDAAKEGQGMDDCKHSY